MNAYSSLIYMSHIQTSINKKKKDPYCMAMKHGHKKNSVWIQLMYDNHIGVGHMQYFKTKNYLDSLDFTTTLVIQNSDPPPCYEIKYLKAWLRWNIHF